MSGLELYMVGLVVTDMEKSVDFYRRLGMALSDDAAAATHVEVLMKGGLTFFLDSRPQRWDPDYPTTRDDNDPEPYRSLLEVYLEGESAVEEKYAEMTGFGYRGLRTPYSTSFGMRFAMVNDPDGNTILLSGTLDESQ